MSETDGYTDHLPPELAERRRALRERAQLRWKQEETKRFWRRMLSEPTGRAEIWRILDEMDAFRTQFRFSPGGQTDRDATMFNLGRSTYGFELYQQLMVIDPTAIMTMHTEFDPRFTPDAPETPNAQEGQ